MLKAGQSLLLNNRRWHLRQVRSREARQLELEAIGVSEAAQGMTRRLTAIQYGDELFIAKKRIQEYWYAHLEQDWRDDELGPILACRSATWLDLLDAHTRHPAAGELKNEFSWSYFRAARYRQCPRAYYYHYYAAWEGWRKDAPAPVQRAYLLKNLTDLSLWGGNLVHESIKFAVARLKAGQIVPETDLIERMYSRARADFEDSRSGRYRRQPNQLTGFQEHYYRVGLPPSAWQAAWTRAEQLLRTFLQSALYAHLRRQSPATFLDVEELRAFTLAGAKVWVQLDLARREEDTIIVYDWKTGPVEEAEVRQQLGIYGLYLRQAWPEPVKGVRGIVYALAEDRLLEFELDEPALQETQAAVEAGIAELRARLLEPRSNLAELRRFPMIDDLAECRRCQFRELCGRA
ncbi:MAG: PD-(D/E)XK nuclease family protein [Chloroflexota bacterium]